MDIAHAGPYALIVGAFAMLAIAFILPDNRANPDRVFGLNLRGVKTKKKRTPVTSRAKRIFAAAKIISENRRSGTAALATDNVDDELHDGLESFDELAEIKPTIAVASKMEVPAVEVVAAHVAQEIATVLEVAAAPIAAGPQLTASLAETAELRIIYSELEDEPAPIVAAAPIWPRLLGLDSALISEPERLGIVLTLGAIGEERIVPVICEVLAQEQLAAIRDAALEAIRDAGLSGALNAVEDSLSNARDRERLLAVECLASFDTIADDGLFGALADPCVAVVMAAAKALQQRGAVSPADLREEVASGGDEEKAERVLDMISTIG